jgi:hypothetical protein
MCTSRGRPRTVFKQNPATSRRTTCAYAVEEPDDGDWWGWCVNGNTLGEHPLIERRAVDADQATDFGMGQNTLPN